MIVDAKKEDLLSSVLCGGIRRPYGRRLREGFRDETSAGSSASLYDEVLPLIIFWYKITLRRRRSSVCLLVLLCVFLISCLFLILLSTSLFFCLFPCSSECFFVLPSVSLFFCVPSCSSVCSLFVCLLLCSSVCFLVLLSASLFFCLFPCSSVCLLIWLRVLSWSVSAVSSESEDIIPTLRKQNHKRERERETRGGCVCVCV